uniref:Putative secreted protein n=1 Tax=Ixodes ricinus TaxID=34613 RepID=A0A6B0UN66_IXORI
MLRYSPLLMIFVRALPVDASESFLFQGERPSHFACVFGLSGFAKTGNVQRLLSSSFFSQFILCPCATVDCCTRTTPFSCMVSPEPEKDSLHSVACEAVRALLSAITSTNIVMCPKCPAR